MNLNSKVVAGVLFLGVLGSLSSCTAFREMLGFGYEKPEVKLRGIEVTKASLTGLELQVRLGVKNRNSFDMTLFKLDYKVQAVGLHIAEGVYEGEFTVKAQNQGEVVVPLKLDTQNAFKLLQLIMQDKGDDPPVAQIDATIEFDTPIGRLERTFRDEKDFGKISISPK